MIGERLVEKVLFRREHPDPGVFGERFLREAVERGEHAPVPHVVPVQDRVPVRKTLCVLGIQEDGPGVPVLSREGLVQVLVVGPALHDRVADACHRDVQPCHDVRIRGTKPVPVHLHAFRDCISLRFHGHRYLPVFFRDGGALRHGRLLILRFQRMLHVHLFNGPVGPGARVIVIEPRHDISCREDDRGGAQDDEHIPEDFPYAPFPLYLIHHLRPRIHRHHPIRPSPMTSRWSQRTGSYPSRHPLPQLLS